MERLPYIDEHDTHVSASRDRIWEALVDVLRHDLSGGTQLARVLGCDPSSASSTFDGRRGQTLPGFRVVHADPGRSLELDGRHRFARYRLTFLLEDERLRAETRAAFPGALGRLYRAAVISSGAHRLVTRRLLRHVALRAPDMTVS